MAGDPIYTGAIAPGRFCLQPGSTFRRTQWGWDTGRQSLITHPLTSDTLYPKVGDHSTRYPRMYVSEVAPRDIDGVLVEIELSFKGQISTIPGISKEHLIPGAGVAMYSLPGLGGDGSSQKVTFIAPVPKPSLAREYLTTEPPTLDGVGLAFSAGFLPTPLPEFSITYVPDPAASLTRNYTTGWVLERRTWDHQANRVWLVHEDFAYYYSVAV